MAEGLGQGRSDDKRTRGGVVHESDTLDWIARASAGDMEGLSLIYLQHKNRLFNVARLILKDHGNSHDIVVDVLLRICELPQSQLPTQNGLAWLCRLVRNRALDVKKQERRFVLQSDMRKFSLAVDEDASSVMETWDLLDILDSISREIVRRRIIDGKTHREIAAALGLNSNTVRRKYQQALRMLRNVLLPE